MERGKEGCAVGGRLIIALLVGIMVGGLVTTASPARVVTEYIVIEPQYTEDDPRWACSAKDDTPCVGRVPVVRMDDTPHDRCMGVLSAVGVDISLCEPLLTKGDQP